jgi:hypothetical protein
VSHSHGIVEVAELMRTVQPVRTAHLMATRVVAVVEHPAAQPATNARGSRPAPPSLFE